MSRLNRSKLRVQTSFLLLVEMKKAGPPLSLPKKNPGPPQIDSPLRVSQHKLLHLLLLLPQIFFQVG